LVFSPYADGAVSAGIYRLSGSKAMIDDLKRQFDNGGRR